MADLILFFIFLLIVSVMLTIFMFGFSDLTSKVESFKTTKWERIGIVIIGLNLLIGVRSVYYTLRPAQFEKRKIKKIEKIQSDSIEEKIKDILEAFTPLEYIGDGDRWRKTEEKNEKTYFYFSGRGTETEEMLKQIRFHLPKVEGVKNIEISYSDRDKMLYSIPSDNFRFVENSLEASEFKRFLKNSVLPAVKILSEEKDDEQIQIIVNKYNATIDSVYKTIKDSFSSIGEVEKNVLENCKYVLQSFSEEIEGYKNDVAEKRKVSKNEKKKLFNEVMTARMEFEKEYVTKIKTKKLS